MFFYLIILKLNKLSYMLSQRSWLLAKKLSVLSSHPALTRFIRRYAIHTCFKMSAYLVIIATLLYICYYFFGKNDYWKKRNVPYLKAMPFFGNYKEYILLQKFMPQVAREMCEKFPKEPYIGVFYGTEPALIIQDPELIKLVLVKDFNYFNGREITEYTQKEITTKNIFFTGGNNWKVVRQNLTPIFTSAKIKGMFPLINSCASNLETRLKIDTNISKKVDVKSMLANYTMDCITSCGFGFNAETLKKTNNTNPFVTVGTQIFEVSKSRGLKSVFRAMWPKLFYGLKFKIFSEDIANFFNAIMSEVFDNREKLDTVRHDFINEILKWKKEKFIKGESIVTRKSSNKTEIKLEVNQELLITQSILFFAAGYETTASSISHVLYELSKNEAAQAQVIEEVDFYLKKHNGVIEYECVNEMPFLEACIQETLRLHPVIGVLTREVMEDYTLPSGLRLEKGLRIHIPVLHLHHNPDNFPEPEKFYPERFLSEEKKNMKPFTYLPFGEGPRICIGMRFSKMAMIAGLISVFKNYRVKLADGMSSELDFEPTALVVTVARGGIHLNFIPRET